MGMRRSDKVIITCAITGGIHTPSMSPYLPITPAQIAAESVGLENGVLADTVLRGQIASYEIDALSFRLMMERAGDMAKVGQAHPAISSLLKYYGTELNKRRHELLMSLAGAGGLYFDGNLGPAQDVARGWLRSKGNSIEGGTSEIMLDIVAKRLIELPAD